MCSLLQLVALLVLLCGACAVPTGLSESSHDQDFPTDTMTDTSDENALLHAAYRRQVGNDTENDNSTSGDGGDEGDGDDDDCPTRILKVKTLFGKNLCDRDDLGIPGEDQKSDPYVKYTAVNKNGKMVTRRTSVKKNNHEPVWDEEINFGEGQWKELTMQICDDDTLGNDGITMPLKGDDILSFPETLCLPKEAKTLGNIVHRGLKAGSVVYQVELTDP